MAPDDLILILFWMLLSLKDFVYTDTRVEVSIKGGPIIPDSLLVVQCKIWDLPERAIVRLELQRDADDSTVDIASGTEGSDTGVQIISSDRRYFLSTKRFPDNSIIYFLTITDITAADQGRYVCDSVNTNYGNVPRIEKDYAWVKMHYFPGNDYPKCTATPTTPLLLPEARSLTLSCKTNKGNPPVNVSWHYGSENANISTRQWINGDELTSELHYTLQMQNQGAVFICRISSDVFWGRSEICQVGPLTLVSRDSPPLLTQHPRTPQNSNPALVGPPSGAAVNCQDNCDDSPSLKIHILTIAVIFTTILCLVFLVTTLIMWYKVRNKKRLLKAAENQNNAAITEVDATTVAAGPGTVPRRYVRTPRPRPPSLSTMPTAVGVDPIYMTLEPPEPSNNRNSIIIPKEIYDRISII